MKTKTRGHGPLSESTFLILLSLAQEPRHGYAILKEVETLSADRHRLSTGTLYGALKRLLEDGWIVGLEEQVPAEAGDQRSGRRRRSYTLTDRGRKELDAEISRMAALMSAVSHRRAEGPA